MGRRLCRGGGGNGRSPFSSPSAMNSTMIIRRIKFLNLNSFNDPDLIIQRLRENYPDYARIKLQSFSKQLHQALQHLRDKFAKPLLTCDTSSSSFSECERPSRKKRGNEDLLEERLLRAESEHIRRWQRNNAASSSPSESSDDPIFTSDDAFSEESMEPQFDVMKSMLLEKYVKQSTQNVKKGNEENNVEIEAIADEKGKIAIAMKDDCGSGKYVPVVLGVCGGDQNSNMVSMEQKREGPRFQDLGGVSKVLEELMMDVIVPLYHPELPNRLGVRPVAGILLHGPPGCGKTKLAHAIANETGAPFYRICATEVVSGVSGASEEKIRDLFNKAHKTSPSIVFIDEIDAIASKRETLQREMERRIVTQLMTCMDESPHMIRAADNDFVPEASDKVSERKPGYVLVIGATNRPDALDQALRRPGRFDKEIALGIPDENARAEILSVLTRNLRLEGKFDRFMIARFTPGFVGADLAALVNKAGNLAMKRLIDKRRYELSGGGYEEKFDWWRHPWSPEEILNLSVTMGDFEEAIKLVQPSTKREGFSSIPNVKWEDVGGLNSLRKAFDRYIVQCIKHPEDYQELGVDMEAGFLLFGPPGCGKTLIAKAIANEAGANFIHIKGPEILSKYVGESEQEVRTIFKRARTCSPCILFFDEVDALAPKRGREGAWVVERALNQLLIELDGADLRHGVYVIGATNRIEVIDPALLRPGRFGRIFYVPLPSADERVSILKALSRKKPVSPDVDYKALSSREACRNLTGADLAALVNEAAMAVKDEKQMHMDQGISYNKPLVINLSHFEKALEMTTPSVSEEQRRYYEALSQKFRAS